MAPKLAHGLNVVVVGALATLLAGCGDLARQGRAPSQLVITSLEGASGALPDEFGGTINSDVETIVERTINGVQVQTPTIFSDLGRVTLTAILKDPGQPGLTPTPTSINNITITRYRVVYRRSDGRNTAGVDVPFPFDGAATMTVPVDGNATVAFEIVRHVAKEEAPLLTLARNANIIYTIGEVTFYGHDQAGNAVSVTGSIGISFGNFGDPE